MLHVDGAGRCVAAHVMPYAERPRLPRPGTEYRPEVRPSRGPHQGPRDPGARSGRPMGSCAWRREGRAGPPSSGHLPWMTTRVGGRTPSALFSDAAKARQLVASLSSAPRSWMPWFGAPFAHAWAKEVAPQVR